MRRTIPFLVNEALTDLARGGWMAAVAVALTALSFLTLGGFLILSDNLGEAIERWRTELRVILYLRGDVQPNAQTILAERILRQFPEVRAAKAVTKAEALSRLEATLGNRRDLLAGLPENPLPASVEVWVRPEAQSPERVEALARRLGEIAGVEEVQYGAEWVKRLADWRRLLTWTGAGAGLLLAVGAVLTVMASVVMTTHSRREEIQIMRLVGATEGLLRGPLLIQGTVQGTLGAAVALGLLYLAYHLATPRLMPLVTGVGVPGLSFLPWRTGAILILSGGLLGMFGSLLSFRREESGW